METCSFCGRKITQVSNLIRSMKKDGVYICSKCAKTCYQIVVDCEADDAESNVSVGNGIGIDGLTPSKIHSELDRFIVGQEKAKKVLSVAIYNHNKRLHDESGLIKKSNILIAGPSGCGKTLLARTLAKILDVPFVVADATSLTEAGYVGDDVEVCLQRLLEVADGDLELAQKGIVYLDEIDKIAREGENKSITRDVSGEGVQSALLKLIEGCEVSIPVHGKRKHPNGENVMFDTSNVLFICGGAFEGMFDKKEEKHLGFSQSQNVEKDKEKEVNDMLTPDTLKKYGIMPELIGRLPVLCALSALDEDDLVRILTEPEDAITKEYQLLFEKDDVILEYDEDALREVARISLEKKTGARGLRTILEDVMLDIMYSVPDEDNVEKCIITKESIKDKNVKIIYGLEGKKDTKENQKAVAV